MFVREQGPAGGWSSNFGAVRGGALQRGSPVDTAFAILFLRRKFQKVLGPITPRTVVLASLTERSGAEDVAQCAEALAQRGKAALPDVLKALRDDVAPRR